MKNHTEIIFNGILGGFEGFFGHTGSLEASWSHPGIALEAFWERFGPAWESSWGGLGASVRRLVGDLEDYSSLDGAPEWPGNAKPRAGQEILL